MQADSIMRCCHSAGDRSVGVVLFLSLEYCDWSGLFPS